MSRADEDRASPSNVTSLDEARRRAADRKKAETRAARKAGTAMSARDWVLGGAFLAMAAGGLWYFLAPLFGTGLPR
ncbi:MAG: hypothetical protein JSS20_16010 [Proteobacteria bacterium]|nr:hypothetical protein [Pseudomonadota bacterium]